MRPTGGDIHLAGVHVSGATPDQLTRAGLCLVPEGRGVFPNLTVDENLWLASYAGVPLSGSVITMSPSAGDSRASSRPIRRRASYSDCPIITLSGRAK